MADGRDNLSISALDRIDEVCGRFEEQWAAGQRPRIHGFLPDKTEEIRSELFRELLRLDVEYRRKHGELPAAMDYETDWPEYSAIAATLFRRGGDGQSSATGRSLPENDRCRFEIVEPHAEGALGKVSLAVDRELNRTVALKEMQDRFAGDETQWRRFLREAEITGRLEHPGIVPVYGLGRYPDGQPYYAMRFVRGQTLRAAIDKFHEGRSSGDAGARSLELRQLLGCFVVVCNAVNYAHTRGVLHRDLKPDNVMLGEFGETLVVDWGLARRIADEGEDTSLAEESSDPSCDAVETQTGAIVGTPSYMSPEQAAGAGRQLGPTADVYSLGAILYCILTGRSPFSGVGMPEVLDHVRSGRFQSPGKLNPAAPKSLRAVCLKAMAVSTEDRYQSARELAVEVERWLADEPVRAAREPFHARAFRWARHHRTLVTSSVAVTFVALISLAAGLFLIADYNRRLTDANINLDATNVALTSSNRTLDATNTTLQHRNEELQSAHMELQAASEGAFAANADARAFADFLVKHFLQVARPEGLAGGLGVDVTVRQALAHAERGVETVFAGRPRAEATARNAIGVTWSQLGEHPKALTQLKQAVAIYRRERGTDHDSTLAAQTNLAAVYVAMGDLQSATKVSESTLRQTRARFSESDPRTLTAENNWAMMLLHNRQYDSAAKALAALWEKRKRIQGADHFDTLMTQNNLAGAYQHVERGEDAIRLLQDLVDRYEWKLGTDHLRTVFYRHNLATAYANAGGYYLALPLLRECVRGRRAKLGAEHPHTKLAERNVQNVLRSLSLLTEKLRERQSRLGADHSETLTVQLQLGAGRLAEGRTHRAIELLNGVFRHRQDKLGITHSDTLFAQRLLADAYRSANRIEAAARLYSAGIAASESAKNAGETRRQLLRGLAHCRIAQRTPALAIPLLEKTIESARSEFGEDHRQAYVAMLELAAIQTMAGRYSDALRIKEQAYRGFEQKFGFEHPLCIMAEARLLKGCFRAKRYRRGEEIAKKRIAALRAASSNRVLLSDYLLKLGKLYLHQGRMREAESALRESRDIGKESAPFNPQTFVKTAWLGVSLAAQQRFHQAEPLLVGGLQDLVKARAAGHFRNETAFRDISNYVIKLYEAWDKPREAEAWRKRRDRLDAVRAPRPSAPPSG